MANAKTRMFKVAEGHGLHLDGKKYTGGDILELTSKQYKMFREVSLLPYVPDDDDDDDDEDDYDLGEEASEAAAALRKAADELDDIE